MADKLYRRLASCAKVHFSGIPVIKKNEGTAHTGEIADPKVSLLEGYM